jgi:hypothetical protein
MREWAEYPSGSFWSDPRIGGFDPQNIVVEGKKKRKIMGRGRGCTWMGLGTNSKKKSMWSSLVLKRTEKIYCSGYKNCLEVSSNQGW